MAYTPAKIISVQNISKAFGKTKALENASFDVDQGEIFGFLGPNGAGKTTTIRMLLDLLRPDSGNISLFGKNISSHSIEIRQQCGYLPGEFTAYNNLTGIEFLNLIKNIRKPKTDDCQSLFTQFGLTEHDLNRRIKYLSHGTIQKIGIIQAFFHSPSLLILDEPTTGLDPLMQEVFYQLVFEEKKKGNTVFLSSHNLAEVEKLCSRVAIIRKGRIVSIKPMDELKERLGRTINIKLKEPIENLEIKGTKVIQENGLEVSLRQEGELSGVLEQLAKLPVADISISKPELEEVFIEFYKDDNDEKI